MSNKPGPITVIMEDVAFIFNNDLEDFYFATSHCFCKKCGYNYENTITNYCIELNHIYDLVLSGTCLTCHTEIFRYIETGEFAATAKNAEAIWKTNRTLKQLKIRKAK